MNSNNRGIPSYELYHNGEKVSFAIRTMEEIHSKLGNIKDVPHRHDYYTILWAGKACGEHYIDYKQYNIRPNYIFFVNPNQVHQVITFGKPEGFVIMFTKDFLHQNYISEEFLSNLGLFSDTNDTPPLKITEDDTEQLKTIAYNIKNTFDTKGAFWKDKLSSYLKLFLIECNKYAPTPLEENPQLLQSSRQIIKEFKLLVETNFSNWHKVSDYARELNISADYLNSVIKNTIGKTAKEFIQNRLVLEAKRLGVHTTLNTKEIAFQIGFEDPSHFSKFFKKTEGLPFSNFRKSIEVNLSA